MRELFTAWCTLRRTEGEEVPLPDKGPAPYAPGHAIEAIIEQVRDKGMPEAIDVNYLSRLVSDGYAHRTRQALEILDLIEPETGKPTPTLKKIKEERSDHLRAVLAEWFNEVYQPILTFVSPNDDIEAITDQFRSYTPDGQRSRMVKLFLYLAHYVGLIDEPPKRARPATKPSPKRERTGSKLNAEQPQTRAESPSQKGAVEVRHGDRGRDRYLDLLIGLAESSNGEPSAELLDRIERVLGVPKETDSP